MPLKSPFLHAFDGVVINVLSSPLVLWGEEGLQLPHRHKKRRRLYHQDSSVIRLRPTHPNHIWAVDFVHDKLSNGRPYKMLTELDEYTREAIELGHRKPSRLLEICACLYSAARRLRAHFDRCGAMYQELPGTATGHDYSNENTGFGASGLIFHNVPEGAGPKD